MPTNNMQDVVLLVPAFQADGLCSAGIRSFGGAAGQDHNGETDAESELESEEDLSSDESSSSSSIGALSELEDLDEASESADLLASGTSRQSALPPCFMAAQNGHALLSFKVRLVLLQAVL